MLTLPGFRMFPDGSSRVFVEVSTNVPVKETRTQGQLVYLFQATKVAERVNTMGLPTMYFPTPVNRITVAQVNDDAVLTIELRAPTDAQAHLKQTPEGTTLSVDFPKIAGGKGDEHVRHDAVPKGPAETFEGDD